MPRLVITFTLSPLLTQIGPLPIRWYGVGYAVAFLVGLALAGRHLRSRGLSEARYANLAFWSIIVGLVAARLYFDVQNGAWYYLTHPQDILATWQGGMAYFGAVFTIPLFLLIWCWRAGLSFWLLADAAALFAAIGQPIGRVGNIFNGDILGYPSNLPWAFAYTNPATMAPRLGVAYQPAALYELLVGLCILGTLLAVRRRVRPRNGALFLLYLALYAVTQFGIFFLRANSVTALGLKQAQLSGLALLLALVPIASWWWWRRTPVTPVETGDTIATAGDPATQVALEVGHGHGA